LFFEKFYYENSNSIELNNILYNSVFGDPCVNNIKHLKITNIYSNKSIYLTENSSFKLELNSNLLTMDTLVDDIVDRELLTSIKKDILDQKIEEIPIYGVYFICCIGNYLDVVEEQINCVVNSGLYNASKEILCFVCLYKENNGLVNLFSEYPKFRLITSKLNLYEKFAINNYKEQIKEDSHYYYYYYVYYFHTKGVTHSNDSIFSKRRRILNFYILQNYKLILKLLKFYNTVGVNLFKYPKMHYSGNFWWATSSYLEQLKDINSKYLAPEMYICSLPSNKNISLSQDAHDGDVDKHICLREINIVDNLSVDPVLNSQDMYVNLPYI